MFEVLRHICLINRIIYKSREDVAAEEVKTIAMGQGNKKSRIVAWTFHSKKEQGEWV